MLERMCKGAIRCATISSKTCTHTQIRTHGGRAQKGAKWFPTKQKEKKKHKHTKLGGFPRQRDAAWACALLFFAYRYTSLESQRPSSVWRPSSNRDRAGNSTPAPITLTHTHGEQTPVGLPTPKGRPQEWKRMEEKKSWKQQGKQKNKWRKRWPPAHCT